MYRSQKKIISWSKLNKIKKLGYQLAGFSGSANETNIDQGYCTLGGLAFLIGSYSIFFQYILPLALPSSFLCLPKCLSPISLVPPFWHTAHLPLGSSLILLTTCHTLYAKHILHQQKIPHIMYSGLANNSKTSNCNPFLRSTITNITKQEEAGE